MPELVDNYDQVVQNAKVIHEGIGNSEELIRRLSFFRHWYYIEEIDALAPSKFIGYKDITVEDYIKGTELGEMDGKDTVRRLREWFEPINDDDYEYYKEKLVDFLSQYNMKPNANLKLHCKRK